MSDIGLPELVKEGEAKGLGVAMVGSDFDVVTSGNTAAKPAKKRSLESFKVVEGVLAIGWDLLMNVGCNNLVLPFNPLSIDLQPLYNHCPPPSVNYSQEPFCPWVSLLHSRLLSYAAIQL